MAFLVPFCPDIMAAAVSGDLIPEIWDLKYFTFEVTPEGLRMSLPNGDMVVFPAKSVGLDLPPFSRIFGLLETFPLAFLPITPGQEEVTAVNTKLAELRNILSALKVATVKEYEILALKCLCIQASKIVLADEHAFVTEVLKMKIFELEKEFNVVCRCVQNLSHALGEASFQMREIWCGLFPEAHNVLVIVCRITDEICDFSIEFYND